MRSLNTKDNVIKPALIGIVVVVLGIALIVNYRYFAKSASAASYVVAALVILAGMGITVSSILSIFKIKNDKKIMELGERTTATFISYNSNKTAGKVAIYYIEYSYELDGKKYVCKSPSQFNWYEVLTLKVVGQFPIKTYNGKSMLDCDLMQMHLDNREAVAELNSKYEQALEDLVQNK